MSDVIALWAVTASLLILAAVIATVGYIWATTSHLGRDLEDLQTRADHLCETLDFDWPTLDRNPDEK